MLKFLGSIKTIILLQKDDLKVALRVVNESKNGEEANKIANLYAAKTIRLKDGVQKWDVKNN